MDRNFVVTLARFHRQDTRIYVLQGFFQGNSIAGSKMTAFADTQELPLSTNVREGLSVRQKYMTRGTGYEGIFREYDLCITLPEEPFHTLKVFQELDGVRKMVFHAGWQQLCRERKMPDSYLETWHEKDGKVYVGGWAVGNSPCRLQVLGAKREKLPCEVTWHYRQDVIGNYPELSHLDPEQQKFGFEIAFPKQGEHRVTLMIAADGQKVEYPLRLSAGIRNIQGSSTSLLRKAAAYYQRNGLKRTFLRVKEKTAEKMFGEKESYMSWRLRTIPDREQLQAQSRHVFLKQPLISIVVPLYKTPEIYLRALVSSVQKQTYRNWELCLSDGSGEPSPLEELLTELEKGDSRIRSIHSDVPLGISENTNAALKIAKGEYIAFADHDDLLPENALYEVVRRINEEPEAQLIYSDEDKVSMDGKTWFQPHFKSDFNIDLLRSMNYICHLTVVSRELYLKAGPLDPAYDGAQDYDFILRCCEKADRICHIPRVLYHWRSHADSTSENPASKMYAFEAGARAVQAHYDRLGIPAKVMMGEYPGLYRTIYEVPEDGPLVSVIIPNKDHTADLDKCISSLMERSVYRNLEIVIVENNSTDPATFQYYDSLAEKYDNVRVVTWEKEFNFSAINNFGVSKATGEYLLLLNNDTELIDPDGVEQLLGPAMREDVGIVGARLFYPDDTIQHAGVIIGYGGIAGHAFQGKGAGENGYFSRIICMSDLSAVTAACMMVRRDVYEQAGGLEEELKVAFNDVDFCLKVRDLGKLVVYNPYSRWYHYESKSRGYEDTPEKIARFNSEADLFLRRHPQILLQGDPYYNPNLSLDKNDFALKN